MSRETDERVEELLGLWAQRRRAGEDVSAQDIVRENPDVADELRAGIETARRLGDVLPQDDEGSLRPPNRVGEFLILREIGRGGMGVVYEAEQPTMRRRVALKVLYPSITNTAKSVERFQREARAAGQLKHTNIVTVHQLGEDAGTWFCAMELVDGHSLDKVLEDVRRLRPASRRRARPKTATESSGAADVWRATTGERRYFQRVAEMIAEIADALHLAHEHGVVHRDVKPANLMVSSDGQLKILDFGLARIREEPLGLTVTGGVIGTPSYMSPEQARSAQVDGRTDVYSLGATMYEVLTLRPPFHARGVAELLQKLRSDDPHPPSRVDRRIPRDLETIVMKALEKEPGKRYATAAEMAKDLRAFAEGRTIVARRVGLVAKAWRAVKRNRMRTAMAAGLVVAAGVVTMLAVIQGRLREERDTEQARRMNIEYESLLAGTCFPLTDDEIRQRNDQRATRYWLEKAVALAPRRPEACLMLALAAGPDDLDAGMAQLDTARDRALPRSTERLARAYLLRRHGRRAEALDLEKSIGPDSDLDAPALTIRALVANMEGRSKEALEHATRAIEKMPAGLYGRLAHFAAYSVRARSGDFEGAITELSAWRALSDNSALNSDLPRIDFERARLWACLGRSEASEIAFTDALATTAACGTPDAWENLCFDCAHYEQEAWRLKATEKAAWTLKATEKALAVYPESLTVQLAAATFRPPAERVAVCERLLARDPRLVRALGMKGAALSDLGRHDEAIATLLAARDLDPTYVSTWGQLGDAYMTAGKVEEASRAYDESIRLDPLVASAWVNKANLLTATDHAAEALTLLDRALEANPIEPTLHGNRAAALVALARYDVALASAEQALRLDPHEPKNHVQKIQLLEMLHRREEQEAAARLFYERDPMNGAPSFADVLRVCKRENEALEILAKCPLLAAHDRFAVFVHAVTLCDLHRWADALPDLDELIRQDPLSAWAHARRGSVLFALHRPAEALVALETAFALAPAGHQFSATLWGLPCLDEAEARRTLGGALLLLGRYEESIAAIDRALALKPDACVPWCLGVRTQALTELGRVDDAVADLKRQLVLAEGSGNAVEMGGVGDRLVELGRPAEAAAAFERALLVDPRSVPVKADAAQFFATTTDAARRDTARATALAKEAVALAPQHAGVRFVLGIALCENGEWKDAVESMERAVDSGYAGDADDWCFLAISLRRVERIDEARRWYEKSVAWTTEHPPTTAKTVRFQREAAEALGLAVTPPAPK